MALDGFHKTVHELLVVPETRRAYVPIFGDGIHGRNPNPQHHLCVFDLEQRALSTTIDLRPYIAPHTLKLGPDGLIYITCENSAVGRGDRPGDQQSGRGDRFRLDQRPSPDHLAGRPAALHRERGGRHGLGDRPAASASSSARSRRRARSPASRSRPTAAPWSRSTTPQPTLFLIDTQAGRVRDEVALEDVPKAAQIARYAPDNSLIGVTSLNSDTVSLIDPSFRAADRDQGRQSADGHGLPWRRIVRRLPGRRLGARHRHSEPAAET